MSKSMLPKSEKTRDYILDKVAPIFNKSGFHGTSLSSITQATGLTKGAVYGNFQDKEDLAIQAYDKNIKRVITAVKKSVHEHNKSYDKLFALTNFYRHYLTFSKEVGGCPILNFGIDSLYQNQRLVDKVRRSVNQLQKSIEAIIVTGVEAGELKKTTDAKHAARMIFTLLEGAVFMAFITGDKVYLHNTADHIDSQIIKDLLV